MILVHIDPWKQVFPPEVDNRDPKYKAAKTRTCRNKPEVFPTLEAAHQAIDGRGLECTIYVSGCSWRPGVTGRKDMTVADIDLVPYLFLDYDGSRRGLDRLLLEVAQPSWIVKTLHGWQPWWEMPEPLVPEDVGTPAARCELLVALCHWAQSRVSEGKVDSRHDLCSLMRFPVPDGAAQQWGPRGPAVAPERIWKAIGGTKAQKATRKRTAVQAAQLKAITPELEQRVAIMREADMRFDAVWQRQCHGGDRNREDASLLSFMLRAGWSESDAWTVLAWRRPDGKIETRPDYRARTTEFVTRPKPKRTPPKSIAMLAKRAKTAEDFDRLEALAECDDDRTIVAYAREEAGV